MSFESSSDVEAAAILGGDVGAARDSNVGGVRPAVRGTASSWLGRTAGRQTKRGGRAASLAWRRSLDCSSRRASSGGGRRVEDGRRRSPGVGRTPRGSDRGGPVPLRLPPRRRTHLPVSNTAVTDIVPDYDARCR